MSELLKPISVREGANEVKAKLRSDLSRVSRVRRAVSIKPTMGCVSCDASGKLPCNSCDGTGKSKIVLSDMEQERCHTCDGNGQVTCVDCAGRGIIPNVHRKKILWTLGLGAAAWAFVLWRIWGGDVLPEQAAKMKNAIGVGGGGGHSSGPVGNSHSAPGAPSVNSPGMISPSSRMPNAGQPVGR
jgi:hypothetical protein